MACIDSVACVNLFSNTDTILQMASCSYDVHAQEIMGALITGASIIMLHPQGNMDFEYLINVLKERHISYLQCVPAYIDNMITFLQNCSDFNLTHVHTIDIGGKKNTSFYR